MWGLTTIVAAFALALVVMSLTFMGGAVVVAVPIAIIGVAIAGFIDFNRRRKTAQSIHAHRAESEDVEFTERDRQTLIPE
jgi:UDP-N-acetylmuramyl pentapeptide phosphotransferase/UDP-N-acetylglucosamine-1-phosphate transferase